jgi:hypothetical protein
MLSVIYAECHLCSVLFMLSVIYAEYHLCLVSFMLNVIYAECCNKGLLSRVIIMNVVMLSVVGSNVHVCVPD